MRLTRACANGDAVTAALEIRDLTVSLGQPGGGVPVLESLSFAVEAGRTIALVGESGCGKSMTALAIMGLMPEGFTVGASSRLLLEGQELVKMPGDGLRLLRGNRMSVIFQEPMTALNPGYSRQGDVKGTRVS